MKAIVSKSSSQIEASREIVPVPSSEYREPPGLEIKRTDKGYIDLIIDFPLLQKQFLTTTVTLTDLTTDRQITIPKTVKHTVFLEPSHKYRLSIQYEFSQTSILNVTTYTYDFLSN